MAILTYKVNHVDKGEKQHIIPFPDSDGATPSDLSWLERREKLVEDAIQQKDLISLRRISALPGGFGTDELRRRAWETLLQTERYYPQGADDDVEESLPPHDDERQVSLDTARSFVSYPKDVSGGDKLAMQEELQQLIVGVLRRYPKLSYFQGYHDIMSVLYLTFMQLPESRPVSRRGTPSPEDQARMGNGTGSARRHSEEWARLRRCAEVVSLCRVRDAMGSGMEGMMGLLRLLKRVLKAADPSLARFSADISPVPTLPFFALSWILCLFSHDVDTLEPIQRMFDYVLARNPISAIYLAVAILVAKKPQMLALASKLGSEFRDDPTLLHPLFARLPPLFSDTPSQRQPPPHDRVPTPDLKHLEDDPNPYDPLPLSQLFQLADQLMDQYPWEGSIIKGTDIMGSGSVVNTYEREISDSDWTLEDGVKMINEDVVQPGGGMLDDDEDDTDITPSRRRLPIRIPRHKLGTAVAVGVVMLGIGVALYSARAGGPKTTWSKLWTVVIHSWSGWKWEARELLSGLGDVWTEMKRR